jgi:uncharacterized protein YkwD
MKLDRVLRPALKLVTVGVLTAVTAVGALSAPSTATASHAPVAPHYIAPKIDTVSVRVSPAFSSDNYEKGVQYWVNVARRHHHLKALTLASCTDSVAEHWSAYLAATDSFYHQSMYKLMNKCNAYYAGETLARGAITPRTLVTMWMHSPPHRAVLMSKAPRRIGIGATPDSRGEWVVAANFMRF